MTDPPLPEDAVIRVSRGNFEPGRFDEVARMTLDTGRYLIPAIKQLKGLIAYYAGASETGSMVHVSVWESDERAEQMSRLKEMIVDARSDADAVGVHFIPIVNFPIAWSIRSGRSVLDGAVLRVARPEFDPVRFEEVAEINRRIGRFLIPAIEPLDGVIAVYAAVSATGSLVNASLWESQAHATQMDSLKEMVVDARGELATADVNFPAIVKYPVAWRI